MKMIVSVAFGSAILSGCVIKGNVPATAWGKRDVSMFNYRADAGQCAIKAALHSTGDNGTYTAGGISGQNGAPPSMAGDAGSSEGVLPEVTNINATPNFSTARGTASAGVYGDHATSDFATRATTQQKAKEMTDQHARDGVLKSCLSDRGYTEFSLNVAQRAALEKLPEGSDARREYLYKLGTDPGVLSQQSIRQ